jgi:hypothetical protein
MPAHNKGAEASNGKLGGILNTNLSVNTTPYIRILKPGLGNDRFLALWIDFNRNVTLFLNFLPTNV